MVNVTIDGRTVQVPEKTTILHAAAAAGIKIPTLCYWEGLNEIGACRVCMVEVEGTDRLFTACNNVVREGMVVKTNTKKVRDARYSNVSLILSEHNVSCATCVRNGNCSLQDIASDLNIQDMGYPKKIPMPKGDPDYPLVRDYTKCIKCMRCIQVCDKVQAGHIWDVVNTGSKVMVDVSDTYSLTDSKCALCGQCITHCPVGALTERDDIRKVMRAVHDPEITTVIQIAPAVRTAWGEYFGMRPEEATVKRLAACLKQIGFDYVFDTDFSADLTIMEEGTEFLGKLAKREENKFPMFTSCCPGWIRFLKGYYPEFIDNVSTAKSPQQMFGPIAKTYFAEQAGLDPEKIFCVSIMPCVAKKAEADIPNLNDAVGTKQDVDASLTTREIVRLIRSESIIPQTVKEEELDSPLGIGTGAAEIFGATGGVMEAALRTAYALVTGHNPEPDAFREVRGQRGWKEATFDLAGTTLNVAVVNGLGNIDSLLTALKKGEVSYDFVECMACPGGCVGGGGQPIHDGYEMAPERAKVLYNLDANNKLRFSHENPEVQALYKNFLGEPLSEKSHHLLHTNLHEWKMPGEE